MTKQNKKTDKSKAPAAGFPKHSIEKVLRIPEAILAQNAGRECTEKEAVGFLGLKLSGALHLELSSCSKYGLLDRPASGKVRPTDLVKKILRPQKPDDRLAGLRTAVTNAPIISEVYKHYRGENLPDSSFLDNALVDKFGVPQDKLSEFKPILTESLQSSGLLSEQGGKYRVLDISADNAHRAEESGEVKKLGKDVKIDAGDTCFVMMPFVPPLGNYYSIVYEPAIHKAGLKAVRADDDIFTTGKIVDQIWTGITSARVLVAELTDRNPNVFYELGLAHALDKPVVLVASNEKDVPFDLHHIRVIYYDMTDPFWGEKLIEKIAENILSALKNPEEAKFSSSLKK
jgi:hypothetical protein